MRHWKQRWSPEADLVFLRKMRVGDGTVLPGDDVSEEHRKLLGLHRLRIWWNAGYLGRKDWGQKPKVEALKAGWYHVTMPDGEILKVRGKKQLEEALNT